MDLHVAVIRINTRLLLVIKHVLVHPWRENWEADKFGFLTSTLDKAMRRQLSKDIKLIHFKDL